VDRVKVGGPGGWDYVTFDSEGQRLFIARSDRVQVWSAKSRAVVAEIPGTSGVHGIALAHALHRGFTSNGRANTVTVFDLGDLHAVKTIPTGTNPDEIIYEPRSRRVYAFNGRSGSATVIDATSLDVVATIPLGGKPEAAVSDDAGRVFVNIEDTAELAVIDPATNRVVSRWPLAPCADPTGLAIDAAHARLFTVCRNHQMLVVDAASGRHVATLPIGASPDGAKFDPALGLAFSANGDGTLTIVHEDDAEHFSVVANLPTQERARTLALDPASHRVYLVTATKEPDSFTVLVAGPR